MTSLRSSAAALDATPVIVSRQALRTAALSLVGGAAAMWVASHVGPVAGGRNDVVLMVLFYIAVCGLLPLQLLALTRPLVLDVMENSDAPRLMKWVAAFAVSAGSLLTALACRHAFLRICGL